MIISVLHFVLLIDLSIQGVIGQSHRMSHKNDIPEFGDVTDRSICDIHMRTKVILSRDNLSRPDRMCVDLGEGLCGAC